MITVFVSESRGGMINITSEKDSLPVDAIRTAERVFPSFDDVLASAEMYWNRGYQVFVNTQWGNADYEQ